MLKNLKNYYLLLILVFYITCALATPIKLKDYFNNIQSLKADFTEIVSDENTQVVQYLKGHMLFQKQGNKFRWDYYAPNNQIIIAKDNKIWFYDMDLAQITVRKMTNYLNITPIALLIRDAPLDELFNYKKLYDKAGLAWYNLEPKHEYANCRYLRLAFRNDVLSICELVDQSGMHTIINFSKIELNQSIDSSLFNFIPPPGIDTIGDID